MTTQQYASWVEPLAQSYREVRAATAELARTATDEQLARPTGDDGWSVRDELVHIAAADPDFIGVLGSVVGGQTVDTSIFADIDGRNKRNLDAWRPRPMGDVAALVEESGRALQGLLSRLTADDERRQPDGFPFDLGELVTRYGQHAPYHLGQIREALGRQSH